MLQHAQESVSVAPGCSYHSLPPQQRGHPTRQIKPFAVLAGGGNPQPLTLPGPAPSQAGVEAKTSLILKNDGLLWFEMAQFFLTSCENHGNLWHGPVDKHSWPSLGCSPTGAASTAPVALSASPQNVPLHVPPALAHPRQPWISQIPEDSFPDAAPTVPSPPALVESDGQVGAPVSEPGFPLGSLRESIAPESCDSAQTKRLPVPAAGPPKPAIRPRSLSPSTPPELALPGPIAPPWWLPGAPKLKLSWEKNSINFTIMQYVLLRLY